MSYLCQLKAKHMCLPKINLCRTCGDECQRVRAHRFKQVTKLNDRQSERKWTHLWIINTFSFDLVFFYCCVDIRLHISLFIFNISLAIYSNIKIPRFDFKDGSIIHTISDILDEESAKYFSRAPRGEFDKLSWVSSTDCATVRILWKCIFRCCLLI